MPAVNHQQPLIKFVDIAGFVGRDVQDCCQHDQRQDSRGHPQDVQHQERLHSQRRGTGQKGERMVRGEVKCTKVSFAIAGFMREATL